MANAAAQGRPSTVWYEVLAVAACGAVATAHGVYEVVRTCGVGVPIAALYVPITDGLGLVAYRCTTTRLSGLARAYAWFVVVAAGGLSGLAQAITLAGLGEPPWLLKFGVGYWPAFVVVVAAHLLWLVRRVKPAAAEPARRERDAKPSVTASAPPTPPVAVVVRPQRPVAVAAASAPPRRDQVTAYTGPPVPFGRREKGPCDCSRCSGKSVSWDTWRNHHQTTSTAGATR